MVPPGTLNNGLYEWHGSVSHAIRLQQCARVGTRYVDVTPVHQTAHRVLLSPDAAVRCTQSPPPRVAALQGASLELETPRTAQARKAAGPMITGNAQADADIIAFYKARQELMSGQ